MNRTATGLSDIERWRTRGGELLPPRLGMDDYETFVTASLARTDPAKAARQKAIEERILTPFRLVFPPSSKGL